MGHWTKKENWKNELFILFLFCGLKWINSDKNLKDLKNTYSYIHNVWNDLAWPLIFLRLPLRKRKKGDKRRKRKPGSVWHWTWHCTRWHYYALFSFLRSLFKDITHRNIILPDPILWRYLLIFRRNNRCLKTHLATNK